MYIDHWWVMLQLGLAIVGSVRGWGFSPWGIILFGIMFGMLMVSLGIAFVGNVFWPDLLITGLLFLLAIVPNEKD